MKRVALPGSAVKVWFLGQDLNRGPSLSEKKRIRQANQTSSSLVMSMFIFVSQQHVLYF